MISSGPLVLSSGVLLSVTDPTWTQPCATTVQIQNSSGFLIQASIGGVQYLIQPYTASTVPTNKTPYLNIMPGQPQGNFGALIAFAWMQPGEMPPMADGPLTQGSTQSLGLLTTMGVGTFSVASITLNMLPTAALGYAYSLYSLIVTPVSTVPTIVALQMVGEPGNVPLFVYSGASFVPPITELLNGALSPLQIWAEVTANADETGVQLNFTLRYDLFPLPIS